MLNQSFDTFSHHECTGDCNLADEVHRHYLESNKMSIKDDTYLQDCWQSKPENQLDHHKKSRRHRHHLTHGANGIGGEHTQTQTAFCQTHHQFVSLAYDPNCSSCISFKDKGENENEGEFQAGLNGGVGSNQGAAFQGSNSGADYKDSMTFKNRTVDGNSEVTFKDRFSGADYSSSQGSQIANSCKEGVSDQLSEQNSADLGMLKGAKSAKKQKLAKTKTGTVTLDE